MMDSGLKLWGVMTSTVIVLGDDNPTLVKAAARLAKVVFHDRIQICDNVADEVQINTSIDTGHHVVLLGNFTIAAPITDAVDYVTLEAQGRGTVVTLADNSDCHMITIGGDGWAIKSISLDGNKANQTTGSGIFGGSTHNDGIIDGVYVTSCKLAGIEADGDNWKFDNSHVESCDTAGFMSQGDSHTYSNDTAKLNGTAGFELYNGATNITYGTCIGEANGYCNFYADGSGTAVNTDVTHNGCDSIGATDGDGFRVTLGDRFEYNGCHSLSEAGTSVGSWGFYGARDITLSGSLSYDANGSCIWSEDNGGVSCTRITVTGCDLLIPDHYIWYATNTCHGVIFSSNTVLMDVDFESLYVVDGDDWVVAGNNIDGGGSGQIQFLAGDDLMLVFNRLRNIVTPIDLNNANVVRPVLFLNDWEGCTNPPSMAAAVNPRRNFNITTDGTWWTTNDGQPTPRSIILTARGGKPSATAGCGGPTEIEMAGNKQSPYVLEFDGSAVEYAEWDEIVLPDDYGGGTITATFHWTGVAGAGTVIWGLQAICYANDEPLDAAWGGAVEVTDTFIAADDEHESSSTAAITIAGTPAAGRLVFFRAYRDGVTDTKGEDARLLSIKVGYTGR